MDWVWIAKAAGEYGISYPSNGSLEAFLESIGATVEDDGFQQTLKTSSSVNGEYMRGYREGFNDGVASPGGTVHLNPSGIVLKPCTKHPDRYCNCEGFIPACWDGNTSQGSQI
ncbi:hypothetical protein EOA64_00240 [Mesorhizobium sp. M1A.F.Ca.IN.022.02.1.1]|uniref:hypothetical protein n=1 Tax=Mesorhizobium sp. M1A.F.Ca.IN.022.02.1.1 TaxID=2496766 RepID=UPI000FCB56F1|nr:hypothetical protein [Mesorhizobium sp. M1A.F.Ca.IN.022.02.1.1]RUV65810.1 hypothetical protein EOA64_00240 [Mesorhizobium sp. M1A.F.Ca.IN.022.02.1.1]